MSLNKKGEQNLKHKSWSIIADELGGQYIHNRRVPDKILVREGEYLIIIDTCPAAIGTMYIDCTRLMLYFASTNRLSFLIFNKDIFSKIFSIFYGPYIKTGFQQIDQNFFVKSNSWFNACNLLSSVAVRSLILKQPSIYLEIKSCNKLLNPDFPKYINVLYYESIGIVNIEKIKEIILLFKEILTQLRIIGSISEKSPKITAEWLIDNNFLKI